MIKPGIHCPEHVTKLCMNWSKPLQVTFMLNLILFGWSGGVWAQNREKSKTEIGLLAEYAFMIPTLVDGRIGDNKFVLIEYPENLDGFRVGTYGRINRKKSFVNLELSYFQGYSSFSFVDLQPDPDIFPGADYIIGLSGFKHRMFKFNVGYGINLFRNISLDAGLVGMYQVKDWLGPTETDSIPGRAPMNERANWLLGQSFSPFVISGYLRASYHFGPLNIYLLVEQNLTSVFGNVLYRGEYYPVSVRLQQWSLGVSYIIFSKDKE